MCYERLFQWAQSEADARKTIELKPGFIKGHVRLVKALKEAGKDESDIATAMANGKEAVDAKDLKGLEAEVRSDFFFAASLPRCNSSNVSVTCAVSAVCTDSTAVGRLASMQAAGLGWHEPATLYDAV